MRVRVCARARVRAHVHTCTRAHAHTCTRAHAHTCTRAHAHTCTRAHVHTCARAHTHTHTHTHTRARGAGRRPRGSSPSSSRATPWGARAGALRGPSSLVEGRSRVVWGIGAPERRSGLCGAFRGSSTTGPSSSSPTGPSSSRAALEGSRAGLPRSNGVRGSAGRLRPRTPPTQNAPAREHGGVGLRGVCVSR